MIGIGDYIFYVLEEFFVLTSHQPAKNPSLSVEWFKKFKEWPLQCGNWKKNLIAFMFNCHNYCSRTIFIKAQKYFLSNFVGLENSISPKPFHCGFSRYIPCL